MSRVSATFRSSSRSSNIDFIVVIVSQALDITHHMLYDITCCMMIHKFARQNHSAAPSCHCAIANRLLQGGLHATLSALSSFSNTQALDNNNRQCLQHINRRCLQHNNRQCLQHNNRHCLQHNSCQCLQHNQVRVSAAHLSPQNTMLSSSDG